MATEPLQAQGHHPLQPPHSPPGVAPHSHTASAHTTTRPPVFSFPTLHLGSFDSFSHATAQPTDTLATDPSAAQPFRPSSPDSMSSRSSSSGRLERVPPTSTTMALPTLPSLSPISPIAPPSPSYYSASSLRRPNSALSPPFPAYDDASNSSSSGTLPPTLQSNRPLGHSLTISIPGPLTPSPSDREGHVVPSPPVFKPSPGIARRRTVIQHSSVTYEPSPVRVSETSGTITPPRDMSRSPTRARAEGSGVDRDVGADVDRRERQVSVERGSILMPEPQPTPQPTPLLQQRPLQPVGAEAGAGSGSAAAAQSPRRLEKKTASHDLRNTSPSSPTTRRSLPRPPQQQPTGRDSGMPTKPSISDLSQATAHQPSASSFPRPHPRQNPPAPAQQPQQRANSTPAASPPAQSGGNSWPPLNISARTPQALSSPGPASHPAQQRVPPPQAQAAAAAHAQQPKPAPAFNQRHQQNASASTLPVIGGLADAGPYPSGGAPSRAPPPQLQQRPPPGAQAPTNQAGVGANGVGMGRPPVQNGGAPTRRPPPQEEVCLECMMRDRDLADVDVQGAGVWGRASDAGFEDLRWREEALLKSMGNLESGEPPAGGFRKIIDDDSGGSSDEGGSSALSKGGSVEDVQARKKDAEERRRRRSMVRAKKREADWRVGKEIGWRGFKWEESGDGEGLPTGFRGSKGGKLTEDGIKAIMTKFPSASAHRYQKLQDYLRNQWQLILEIRTEAQRIGHYPLPGEDAASAPSSLSSHDASPAARFPPGALPSALTFDRSAASGSGSGPFTPTRGTNPSLAVMRPSPSSPANLTGLAQGPRLTAPLQRPLTHYLPDREPVLTPLRGSSGAGGSGFASPGGSSARGRHAKNTSSPGMLEKAGEWNGNGASGGDDNEELWEPGGGEGGQGLRPFSFAVRAGAAAARDGSEGGHGGGRRSLWGRWGGSVTSLFGGSQNGSGSMMDMHVGLDSERRNRSSSYNVNSYPRAVSLASPTRPSFFSRDSRTSSIDHAPESGARMSRAISHSRLSQFHTNEDGQDGMQHDDVGGYTGDEPKKKGIKGFFKKMKPKGPRKGSTRIDTSAPPLPQHQGYVRGDAPASASAPETPLAPPPPISILVGRGDKTHSRQRSGSSSSFLTDQESPAPAGSNARYSSSGNGLPYATYGARSVSAPLGGNRSSSELSQGQSASPSSSRFATATGAGKRDSYTSTGRRRSGQVNEMGEERSRSVMEMLSTSVGSGGGGGGFGEQMYDEPQTMRGGVAQQQQQAQAQGYPHPSFRPHNKTNSSLSASSGTMLETPPPVSYGSGAFFQQQVAAQQQANGGSAPKGIAVNTAVNGNGSNATPVPTSPTAPLSPNRFKNLPPIPPPGAPEPQQQPNVAASPDSFVAAFPEQEFSLAGTVHDPKYTPSGPGLGSPAQVQTRGVAQQGQQGQQYAGKQAIDFSAGSTYTRREPGQGQNQQAQMQQQQMQGQGYGYGYPQPQQQQAHLHPNPYGQQQQQQQPMQGYSLHPQPRSPAYPSSPGYGAGRASLDQRSSQTRAGGQRAVQTMYGHPGMPGVVGGGYGGFDEGEKKRKGLKGIFGGSKAGRMA
ncbi:hypothetical protein IAT38_001781 [Cryptococcus sp. DSM 104549]